MNALRFSNAAPAVISVSITSVIIRRIIGSGIISDLKIRKRPKHQPTMFPKGQILLPYVVLYECTRNGNPSVNVLFIDSCRLAVVLK